MKQTIDINGPMGNRFCLHGIAIQNAARLGLDVDTIERDMQSADYKSMFKKHFGDYFDIVDEQKTAAKFKRNKQER